MHFPIALLLLGLAAAFRGEDGASAKLLWLGSASAWVAAGLGWVAKWKVPHVPAAWEVLADHETLAYWTTGVFTALSVWRLKAPEGRARLAFLSAWTAGTGFLLSTAYHGGELVFRYGMGVIER